MDKQLHDLTILYLSKQDISSLTPEQLYNKYKVVYKELKDHHKKNHSDGISVLK